MICSGAGRANKKRMLVQRRLDCPACKVRQSEEIDGQLSIAGSESNKLVMDVGAGEPHPRLGQHLCVKVCT